MFHLIKSIFIYSHYTTFFFKNQDISQNKLEDRWIYFNFFDMLFLSLISALIYQIIYRWWSQRLERMLKIVPRNHSSFVTQAATHQVLSLKKRTVGTVQVLNGTLLKKLCASFKNTTSGCGAAGSALPWGNYDRKVNSWPLRPPLRSYQWYRNQRVCSPRNHLSVRHTKWRDNRCYAIILNLLRALLRNRAYECFLSPFYYSKSC